VTPPVNDPETLRRILTNTDALLLDFDGPICSVFASVPASLVADQLRHILAEGGYTDIPDDVRTADDPFDILFYAAKLGQDEARYVEAAFRAHEVEAVRSAQPTPSSTDLIRAWNATGRRLAVVSNNSTTAVETYLDVHNLRSSVDLVAARASADVSLLKPSPFLIAEALGGLTVAPLRSTLIGDSVTDIQASRAAQIAAVGYANKPGKVDRLMKAGSDLIISEMEIVLSALAMS
jgi:phosphoglycolate phosphatase-like HAD superfamily hydrolase